MYIRYEHNHVKQTKARGREKTRRKYTLMLTKVIFAQWDQRSMCTLIFHIFSILFMKHTGFQQFLKR